MTQEISTRTSALVVRRGKCVAKAKQTFDLALGHQLRILVR